MKMNGSLISDGTSEWVRLRREWRKWNENNPDDQIDWSEYLEEHGVVE